MMEISPNCQFLSKCHENIVPDEYYLQVVAARRAAAACDDVITQTNTHTLMTSSNQRSFYDVLKSKFSSQ